MLPFLKNRQKQSAGVIMQTRSPDENDENQQDDPSAAIRACSKALIHAIHMRDETAVSDALSDAFAILEAMPHDENEESRHPHTYNDQSGD